MGAEQCYRFLERLQYSIIEWIEKNEASQKTLLKPELAFFFCTVIRLRRKLLRA